MRTTLATYAKHVGLRRCYVGQMSLVPAPAAPTLPEGLHVGPFRAPDLLALGPEAMDPAMTEHRLMCGDRPWGLWRGRELLCYGWTSTRATAILTLAALVPGPDEAYLFGFYTPPAHRGKGYYPMLLRSICGALAQEGKRRAWIAVFADNPSSWKGVLKAGFSRAATQLTLQGRLSLVLPDPGAPQPTLRPRRRGLHLHLRERLGERAPADAGVRHAGSPGP